MILPSYIINYIIFAISLYFLLFINICLLICTLAIVDVYAYHGWGVRVTRTLPYLLSCVKKSPDLLLRKS